MATTVKELVATFGLETDKQSFNAGQKAVDQVKSAAKALVAVFATGAIAKGFSDMIQLASDSAETLNVLGEAFGANQQDVMDWANTTARAVGRSEFELRRMAATTGALVQPMLKSRSAAAQMSKQVSELAVDLGSFFNVTDEEALRALRAGLVGQSEPLLRFGVNLQQATLQQFALSRGITKSIGEMTIAEKTNLRFQAIMAQTANAQGDAAKTATSFANATKAVKAVVKDIATTIGLFFLPALEKDLQVTLATVRSIRDWIDANKELIGSKINAFMTKFFQVVNNVMGFFKNIIGLTIDWIGSLGPLQKKILGVTLGIGALVAVLLLPGAPIIALIALIGLLIDDFETWRKGGVSVIGDIIAKFKEWFAFLQPAIEFLTPLFTAMWEEIKVAAVDFFGTAKTVAEPFLAKMKEVAQGIRDFDFEGAVTRVKDFFTQFASSLQRFFNSPLGKTLLAVLGAVLGAKVGNIAGANLGKAAGTFLGKSGIPGSKAVGGFLGEKLGGVAGTLVGGISGAVGVSKVVGSMGGGGVSNSQNSNVSVSVQAAPGMDEGQLAQAVADKVAQVNEEQNRAALDALTAGAAA